MGSHGRAITVGALALVLALAGAVAALTLTRRHGVGGLLGSHVAAAAADPLMPTRIVALPGRRVENGTEALSVTLSGPPAAGSPVPTLEPHVAGTWSAVGDAEVFTPASTLMPCRSYTLTVWANTTAIGHARVGRRRTLGLNVACPSIAALQQGLARLGYLGARFRPLYTVHIPAGPVTRREAAEHLFHPPRGALGPDPADAPAIETGRLDETTRGALTVFQSDHGLEGAGEPDYRTWASLIAAESAYRRDPSPYTWVTVSESIPETLLVHRGRHVVLSTPVNTGVAGAETAQGIFPIYSRLESTTMTGTDPDGTKYVAPDVPWVNYFNGGDAVHGYPRASYGTPQSNGCVELPIETAHRVFGMLRLGDIVVVS
jgi:peptidoglycan hydrolase-like protein with peptidoglycan-binding domain